MMPIYQMILPYIWFLQLMSELENYIQTFFGAEKDELAKIASFFTCTVLKKNEFFLRKGRRSTRLGFLQSGFIREYVPVEDREITKWISTQGYFIVDLSSFIFQHPARWNLQALSDCELYTIELKDYRNLGTIVPRWAELEKLFISRCFAILEDRIISHLSMTAEQRYQQLFSFNKELFNQVPLQYLASMLGMTPETFSRIR